MAKKFKINKDRCIGCGTCVQSCDKATELGDDMKAKIIDQEKLEECGGAKVCPFGAIEEMEGDKIKK
ncbi:4Fe-4S binding protein [Patescibacteria group bacterium]|nr:4Fe-4S binding protein [Patescibacteria group bacterium]